MITERHENRNVKIRTLEATFIKRPNSMNRASTMNKPVITRDTCGVLKRRLMSPRKAGTSLSLDKAMGYREADMMPAFAVDMNARMAAIPSRSTPVFPMNTDAPSEMGVNELSSLEASNTPEVTKMTSMYTILTTKSERIIPRGTVCAGFFTSSAIAAILSRPPNEINTRPAVENMAATPFGANDSKC